MLFDLRQGYTSALQSGEDEAFSGSDVFTWCMGAWCVL